MMHWIHNIRNPNYYKQNTKRLKIYSPDKQILKNTVLNYCSYHYDFNIIEKVVIRKYIQIILPNLQNKLKQAYYNLLRNFKEQ